LTNLGSESETCVGSRVHLVGVSISFEKNFYRLPFTPPLWFAVSVLHAVQLITDATVLEENYHRTPTALGHQLVDPLRAVTAPVALAAVALWWLMATPAAEAVAVGAPHTGLEGEPVAEAIAEAEAT
jgi:hypothetical protein